MSKALKILVIRYSSLGDVLLITPVLRLLKSLPNTIVHVLIKQKCFEILEYNPNVDVIHVHETVSVGTLKHESFDIIIDLQKSLRSIMLCFQLRGKRYSYDKRTLDKWALILFKINRLKEDSVVSRFIRSVNFLNLSDDGLGLDFYLDDFEEAKTDHNKKRVVISMGGSYVTKRIPFKYLQTLTQNKSYEYFLIGGNDIDYDHEMVHLESVTNLIGKTTIQETGALIKSADLLITGDTATMHMATALQIPVIVVWGSTSPEMGFAPHYGLKSRVPHKSVSNDQINCRPCSKYGIKKCPKGHMNCLNKLNMVNIHREITELLE